MKVSPTAIAGCYQIQPRVHQDDRGCFFESFHLEKFHQTTGLNPHFVQDNQAESTYGVVRGLHYQSDPYTQAKWVRVVEGEIRDVVVDLRKSSPSFGKTLAVDLSAENRTQLFVPRGCAHGYAVLSEKAIVLYKTDQYYAPSAEKGIMPLDPALNIAWGISPEKMLINARDQAWPSFQDQDFF